MSRAHRTGRVLFHLGVALVCFTRAIAYGSLVSPPHESPGPLFITGDGQFLPAYAAAWGAAGIIAVVELLTHKSRLTLAMFAGLMTAWAISYGLAWWVSGMTSWDWVTCGLYTGLLTAVIGQDRAIRTRDAQIEALTGEIARSIHAGSRPSLRGEADGPAADR